MLKKIDKYIEQKLLPKLFITSKQPTLLKPFLEANKMYDDGLVVDGKMLGYRLKTGKAYIAYIQILLIIIIPITTIAHSFLKHFDLHLLIVSTMIFTWIFFAFFTLFKEWLNDKKAHQRIQEAWQIHLPLFDYNKYSSQVASIYANAINHDINKGELSRFIIDNIIKD